MDKPINQYFTDDVKFIRVYVGPSKKSWTVNKALLRKRASFFEGMLEGEKTRSSIWLQHDDAEAFAHLFDWLHGNSLSGDGLALPAVEASPISPWCKLHILAAKLGVKDLATHALTMYLRAGLALNDNWIPSTTEVLYGYTNLGPGTLFRRTLAYHVAKCMLSTKFWDVETWARTTSCCAEFNRDVAREVKEHTWSGAEECDVEVCAVHEPLPHPPLHVDAESIDMPMTERAESSVTPGIREVSGMKDPALTSSIRDCDRPIPSVERS